MLSDAINLTFVELSKLDEVVKKPVSDMTDLDKWSVFFQYAPDMEHREIVNKVIESEEVLQVAGNLFNEYQQERARGGPSTVAAGSSRLIYSLIWLPPRIGEDVRVHLQSQKSSIYGYAP